MKVRLTRLSGELFNKIKIPPHFLNSPPKPEKIINKMLKFSRESELEDIIIDEDFFLVDGYCSYLIAQQVGVDYVKIKQVRGVRNAGF